MEIKTSGGTKLHLAKTAINEGKTVISTMAGAFTEAENIYQGAASRVSDEESGVTEEDVEAAIRNSLSPQEISSFNHLPSWAARSIRRKVRRELEHKYQAYQLKKEDAAMDASRKMTQNPDFFSPMQNSVQASRDALEVREYSAAVQMPESRTGGTITTQPVSTIGASNMQVSSSGGKAIQASGFAGKTAQAAGSAPKAARTAGKAAGRTAQDTAKTAGKAVGATAKTAGTAAKVGASAGTGAATGGISLAVQGVYEAAKAYVTVSVATANWLRSRVEAQPEDSQTEALSTGFDKNFSKGGSLFTSQEPGHEDDRNDISGAAIFVIAVIVLAVSMAFVFAGSSYTADYDSELPTEIAMMIRTCLPV